MDPCPATLALARAAMLDYHTRGSLSADFQKSLRETSPDIRSKLLRFLRPPGFTKRMNPSPEYVLRLFDKAFSGQSSQYIPRMCLLGMDVHREALRTIPFGAQCRSAKMAAKGGHVELLVQILSISSHDPVLIRDMTESSLGRSSSCDQYLLQHYTFRPQRVLLTAARKGKLELAELFIPQTSPSDWEDAMWQAAQRDHLELVQRLLSLLEAGPSHWQNITTVYSPRMLNLLLQTYTPSLDQYVLNSLLYNAARSGDVPLFELLLSRGADYKKVDSLAPAVGMSGSMPLVKLVQSLTRHLVFWQRALTYAAKKGHLEMVVYLAEWLQGSIPGHALQYAILYQHTEVLSVLLAACGPQTNYDMIYLKKIASEYDNRPALALLNADVPVGPAC